MKLFHCENCNVAVHFDNTDCTNCGWHLGYLPDTFTMKSFDGAEPDGYRRCANAFQCQCNWLIAADDDAEFCFSCRLNLLIPDLSQHENVERWARLEAAKRHFLYGLMRLQLPIITREQDSESGLAFQLLSSETAQEKVITGHDNGLITINIAEASGSEREWRREELGEPLRTLPGHFRHESGHYYWNLLLRNTGREEEARAFFGDERIDYKEALNRHYREGPQDNWASNYVSAYASSHPWEDFAETWAHYLHIVDGLDTAIAYGIGGNSRGNPFDPYVNATLQQLVQAWTDISIAVNAVNRSIGQPDLYPFVFTGPVVEKLGFVHRLIHRS